MSQPDFQQYLKDNIQRDLKQLNKLKEITSQDLDTILTIINKSNSNNNNSYISETSSSVSVSSGGFKKPSIPPKVGGTIGTIELTKKDFDDNNKSKFSYSSNKPKPSVVENGSGRFGQDIKNTVETARNFNNQDSNIDEDRPIASVRSAAAMFGAKSVTGGAGGPPPPVANKPSGFNKANLTKSVSAATAPSQGFRMPQPTLPSREEEMEENSPSLPSRANSIASSRAYPPPSTPERSPMPEPVARTPAPAPEPVQSRAPPALPKTKKPEPYLIEVVAEYDFSGEDETELSFSEGQTVFVTEYIDDQWWKGRCEGKSGMFPSSYVREA